MSKRGHLGICVLLGVGFPAFGPRVWEVPPENVFDFSRVEKKEMPRGAKYVFVGGVYPRGFRYRPLQVHLLLPEGERRFRYGEPTVFEVVLENVGEHVVTVPWSVDWAGVGLSPERPTELPPDYWKAAVSVGAAPDKPTEGEMGYRLVLEGLWGSARLAGSLKRLKPGEAVKFLLPGSWKPVDPPTGEPVQLFGRPIKMHIFARFWYSYQHEEPYYIERAESAGIEIELVP